MKLHTTTKRDRSCRISPLRVGVILLCFFTTFIVLQGATGTKPTKIIQPLSSFPQQFGGWNLDGSRSSSAEVVTLLGVDDYIDYSYVDSDSNHVSLYVGFYESVGGGKGYHSPKNCLPGGGWGIENTKKIKITPGGHAEQDVTVSEMIIRKGDEYQVVLYWFQNRGRIIASEYWEKIYLVFDALMKKRRDGAFVRIMAYVPDGDIKKTEKFLKEFAETALAELRSFIPGKSRNAQPRRKITFVQVAGEKK